MECMATNGSAWESFIGTFTAGTPDTLARTTLLASSTGSAIDWSSGGDVTVFVTPSANELNQLSLAALTNKSETVTAGNITGEVGSLHICSCSGLTADRDFILPANANVGDRVGVYVSSVNASFSLLLKPAAGDTINNGAAGAEWSRLLIVGESVVFRCITANSEWMVEIDGRIPIKIDMELITSCDGETAMTFTRPTQASVAGVWIAQVDNASSAVPASDRINIRRGGNYSVSVTARSKDTPADGKFINAAVYKNVAETLVLLAQAVTSAASQNPLTSNARVLPFAAGDYLVFKYRSTDGGLGLLFAQTWFDVVEQL